ncbi:MAG: hypothetical protein Q9209_006463 [Squamulea sp. 1 TL-2023]
MTSPASKYLSKLQDKRVLVLGRTSGIGFCVAEAALEHGAYVVVSSSTQAKIDKTMSRLRASYSDRVSKLKGFTCDLAQPQNLESNVKSLLMAATENDTRKLDHIVSTAGDSIHAPKVTELTIESIQKLGNVRFFAPLVLAKYAPLFMTPGPRSSITLTSGTIARKPFKDRTVLAAWGSGIEGTVRGLAVDLAPIRVNIVSPGAILTEIWNGVLKEHLEGVLEGFRKETLTGELGTPEDVAEAYLHSMKDGFMTGTVLDVDGGRILT